MPAGLSFAELIHFLALLPLCSYGILEHAGFLPNQSYSDGAVVLEPAASFAYDTATPTTPTPLDNPIDPAPLTDPTINHVEPWKFLLGQFSYALLLAVQLCIIIFLLQRTWWYISDTYRLLTQSPENQLVTQAELRAFYSQLESFRSRYESASEGVVALYRQQLAILEARDRQRAEISLRNQQQETSQLDELREKVSAQHELIESLNERSKEFENTRAKVQEYFSANMRLQKKLDDQHKLCQRLQADLENATNLLSATRADQARIASLEAENVSQQQLIQDYKSDLQKQSDALQELDNIKSEAKEQQLRMEELESQISALTAEKSSIQSAHELEMEEKQQMHAKELEVARKMRGEKKAQWLRAKELLLNTDEVTIKEVGMELLKRKQAEAS